MLIFKSFLGLLVFGAFISTGLQQFYYKKKLGLIKPYGKLVEVFDGTMHLYGMGRGNKTIVLLPGMGVALPSADFGPLMRKLSQKHQVVSLEYFGVGFSSETSRARKCKSYVEEIREALRQGEIKPPYLLMAHSISSLYSEYYAAQYPEEVEGIISLDGTSSAYYEAAPKFLKNLLVVAKAQQWLGLGSILAPFAVNKKKLLAYGYTEKEIRDMLLFSGFSLNNTVIEQISNSAEFIKEAMDVPYPEAIPYFKIISKQTYETENRQLKQAGMTPPEYQKRHLERIGKSAGSEILEGSHFIYLNNLDRIAEITDALIEKRPML